MEEVNEHIDELIAKYLAGEASPEEAMELEDWKQAAPANQAYYDTCYRTHCFLNGQPVEESVDVNSMFNTVMSSIDVPERGRLLRLFSPMRAAAVLAVVALSAWVIYRALHPVAQQQLAFSTGNEAVSRVLGDGSQVQLDVHSSLQLTEGYNGNERRLKLSGSATFRVIHDETKPFVVEAGGVFIRDVGTVFSVSAVPGSDSVRVVVTEGEVAVTAGTDSFNLQAGQTGVYIRSQHRLLNLTDVAEAESARTFRFTESTLREVIEAVNAQYDEKIRLENPELEDCRISVNFHNEPIEVIVTVISETFGLHYRKTEAGYLLSGPPCAQ